MVEAQLGNHLETKKAGSIPHQKSRTKFKWTQDTDVEIKTVRESEENMSGSLYNCGIGKVFQNELKSKSQK